MLVILGRNDGISGLELDGCPVIREVAALNRHPARRKNQYPTFFKKETSSCLERRATSTYIGTPADVMMNTF